MTLQEFFARAIKLESTAENVYRRLIDLVIMQGNLDAMEFFHQMAEDSHLHRAAIVQQAGMIDVDLADLVANGNSEGEAPPMGVIPSGLEESMELALASEQQGVDCYEDMAQTTSDPQIRVFAEMFAAEERKHVLALKRYMGLIPY